MDRLLSKKQLIKLKHLFAYMDPRGNEELSHEDQELRRKVVAMLRLLDGFSQIPALHYQKSLPHSKKTSFSDIVQRLTFLTRECVVTHRWPEALQLVKAVRAERKENTDTTVYRVGMAALYQTEHTGDGLSVVGRFVKQVCHLHKVISVDVVLDYLLYVMVNGDLNQAQLAVQDLKRDRSVNSQLITKKRKLAYSLVHGYQGMVVFAEWKAMIDNEQHPDFDEDIVSQMMSQGMNSQHAWFMAETALELLLGKSYAHKSQSAVWDVFLPCVLEIYEHYNMTEGRDVLVSYRNNNPLNPNSHLYLYNYDVKHGGNHDMRVECLKNLIGLDPGHPLALDLIKMLGPENPEAIIVLFDYLDFPRCDCIDAWQLLANLLISVRDKKQSVATVTECWSSRSDWWPHTRLVVSEGDEEQLRKCRLKVKKRLKDFVD